MLKNKSLKALNILKCVSSTDWGADSTVLLNLYRSKLDYECIIYGSARPSYIKDYDSHLGRLERLQLRVCMLKQTSLPLKKDVSNLVCSMQRN